MNKLDIKIANIANITRVSHDYAMLKYINPRPGYNKKVNMLTIDRHGNIESKECILYLYDRTSLNIIKQHELQDGDILIPKRLSNALPIYIDDASIYKVNNTIQNDGSSTYSNTLDYSMKYKSMYCGQNGTETGFYWWLASPSVYSSDHVCMVDCFGACLNGGNYGNRDVVSPLVSLKSSVQLELAN